MKQKFIAVLVLLVAIVAVGLAGLAQDTPTEAPPGFDTPTLVQNPGSQSHSNGIAQPAGDSYANDQKVYETTHDPSTGLGPVFNARACSDCHQNPVSGGASQFTELRAGHRDANGNFVNPTIPINDGANNIGGRSIVNDRAVVPEAQEHIPASENIRALRAALNTLGDGFVEAIDDVTLETIAQNQPYLSNGRIHGEAIQVPSSKLPAKPASAVSAGRTSTVACCRLLPMPTSMKWASPAACARKTPPRLARSRRILKTFLTIWDWRTSIISRNSFAEPKCLRGMRLWHKLPPRRPGKSFSKGSAAAPATSGPSSRPHPERSSMAACSLSPKLWATKSFTPTAISCFTISRPAMASCKPARKTRPTSCAPRRCGVSA